MLCVENRRKSLKIEVDHHLKKVAIVCKIFLAHLFVYHVLVYTKPYRSKLHEIYICSDDLAKLIRRTVNEALLKPDKRVTNHHANCVSQQL